MATRTIQITDDLHDYMVSVSLREPDVLKRLRAETANLPQRECQIAPEQGQFMAFLVKTLGARNAIEVGVFTGYSALTVALALPDDGRLVACDVSDEWTSVARRYWREAGVDHKIDLRLAPAAETLNRLAADPAQHGAFDFAFIDADKPGYDTYYEHCLKLVRPGGVIALDNMLLSGAPVRAERRDASTEAIRTLNRKLHQDERVDVSLVPIGDGLTLARRL